MWQIAVVGKSVQAGTGTPLVSRARSNEGMLSGHVNSLQASVETQGALDFDVRRPGRLEGTGLAKIVVGGSWFSHEGIGRGKGGRACQGK